MIPHTTLALSLFFLLFNGVEGASLPPGDYVFEHSHGDLVVGSLEQGVQKFTIETVGANGHTCAVEGEIRDGVATIESTGDAPACEIRFAPKNRQLDVSTNGADSCREWCGMRATFEGSYRLPVAACTATARQEGRKRFKQYYDQKKYDVAVTLLPPILAECADLVGEVERRWILNDLAITQFKLGRPADCLATLDPLREEAAKTDDELKEEIPPSDQYDWLPVIKATRANLKLCSTP